MKIKIISIIHQYQVLFGSICHLFTHYCHLYLSNTPFFLQNCLTVGVFSVSPCTGSLQPGSQQVVTVNCAAEQLGNWNQGLLIDISDLDPSDQPDGIPYRLLAEVCKPGESWMILLCVA